MVLLDCFFSIFGVSIHNKSKQLFEFKIAIDFDGGDLSIFGEDLVEIAFYFFIGALYNVLFTEWSRLLT